MQQHGYHFYQDAYIKELMDSLSNEDILALHTNLRKLGYSQWTAWLTANAGQVALYLGETDSGRQKMREKDPNPGEHGFLQFGAIWMAQIAAQVSFEHPAIADKNNSRLRRSARGSVCLESYRLFFEGIEEWPFDEPPLDNPLNAPS